MPAKLFLWFGPATLVAFLLVHLAKGDFHNLAMIVWFQGAAASVGFGTVVAVIAYLRSPKEQSTKSD